MTPPPPRATKASLAKPASKKATPRKAGKRRKPDPIKAWVKRLDRTRPAIIPYVLDGLATLYGRPTWQRRLDPTSELILTILTQSTADVNAEHAFQALRLASPSAGPVEHHVPGPGWGGAGLPDGRAPDWIAVELAPYDELVEVIRPGGLPFAKAKSIQATLRTIREQRGDHSLEFLGDLPAAEAREWLTKIPGIGKKTASVRDRAHGSARRVPGDAPAGPGVRGPREPDPPRAAGLRGAASEARALPAQGPLPVRRSQGALKLAGRR